MKKKTLLSIALLISIFIFNSSVYADQISIVKGSGKACTNGTCFKLGKNSNNKYKVLYCTEPDKDWTSAVDTYKMDCTPQNPNDKMLKIVYMFENGYSEYTDKSFGDILKEQHQKDKKPEFDNTQKAIWKILYPKKYSSTTLSDNASSITLDDAKNALTISEKSATRKNYFISQYKVNVKPIYLHENKVYIELKNVPKELHDKIFISTSSTATYSSSNKFTCNSSSNICSKTLTLTENSKDSKKGQDYYIMAKSETVTSELNFDMDMSVKTYYNPVEKTISSCYKDLNVYQPPRYEKYKKLQKVYKYDRKEYTILKTKKINWKPEKKGCVECGCGERVNIKGEECCYKACLNKCPISDPGEKNVTCNNGVSIKSECSKLSLEENSDNNIIAITEEGTLSNVLSSNEIFAGGSIKFNLIYYNKLSWKCVDGVNCDSTIINSAINNKISNAATIKNNIIAANSKITVKSTKNGSTTTSEISISQDKIDCYNISQTNAQETICTINYTKDTSVENGGTNISISAVLGGLDVLNNSSSNDSDTGATSWTGIWKINVIDDNDSCKVKVKEGKYNKYRYRPIDLDNPFPKGVGINWQSWWNNNSNHFADTFKNKSYEIEITPEVDKQIENYNKNHSNLSISSSTFFKEFDIKTGDNK